MRGALTLSHPAPAGETRGPVQGDGQTRRGGVRSRGRPRGAGVSASTRRPASVPATQPPPAWRADPTPRTRGPASPAGAGGARPRARAVEGSGVFTCPSRTSLAPHPGVSRWGQGFDKFRAPWGPSPTPWSFRRPVYLLLIAPGGEVCSFRVSPPPTLPAGAEGALREWGSEVGMRPEGRNNGAGATLSRSALAFLRESWEASGDE